MKIKSAEFIMSNTDVSKCPKERLPEYAFIGRSNVGKSSLINMLMSRKDLAKTSGRPGKTQLINHFKINENWFLVDLPGYGYAQVSKKKRQKFQSFIVYHLYIIPVCERLVSSNQTLNFGETFKVNQKLKICPFYCF